MNLLQDFGITLLAVVLTPLAMPAQSSAVLSDATLTSEQIQIYRTLLKNYTRGGNAALNIDSQTEPLDLTEYISDSGDAKGCLQGIKLEKLKETSVTFHKLDARILVGKKMVLVDRSKQNAIVERNDPSKTIQEGKSVNDAVNEAFRSGLFTMSEIAFDQQHHWAVLSFSFDCGGLCGHGGVIVLEKIKGGENWKVSKRLCDQWIS